MSQPVRSKKMAVLASPDVPTGHIQRKMVRIGLMADRIFWLDRRELMAGLGAATLGPVLPSITAAEERRLVPVLQAQIACNGRGRRNDPILGWQFFGAPPMPVYDSRRGRGFDFTLRNESAGPGGAELARARRRTRPPNRWSARAPLPAGERENLQIPLRHAGTFSCDLRLLGRRSGDAHRGLCRRSSQESEPVAVDRDEVFLIEDWRLRPDGTAIAPGIDPKDVPLLTRSTAGLRWISRRGPMIG